MLLNISFADYLHLQVYLTDYANYYSIHRATKTQKEVLNLIEKLKQSYSDRPLKITSDSINDQDKIEAIDNVMAPILESLEVIDEKKKIEAFDKALTPILKRYSILNDRDKISAFDKMFGPILREVEEK